MAASVVAAGAATAEWIEASDGAPLLCRRYEPAGAVRGAVVVCPGIRSHSGWYGWSGVTLAAAGWRGLFLDRRGTGANGGPRGDARHADRLLADVRHVLRATRLETAGPVALAGISWGGKVAATLAAEPGACDGLVLLTPGLRARVRVGRAREAAVRAAVALGRGAAPAAVPLRDPRLFTARDAFVRFIERDPLALQTVTLRFVAASLDLDRRATRAVPRIECPVLTLLAGRDEIVDNAATRRLLGRCGSFDLTVRAEPAARHTLEFEPNRGEIFGRLIDWLDRLPTAAGR